MKGCIVLFYVDRPNGTPEITGQGEIIRQLGSDGTHFLCRIARSGYRINEVVSLQRLEKALIFDTPQDYAAFMQAQTPPAEAPAQPPVDNDHVAPEWAKFTENPAAPEPLV